MTSVLPANNHSFSSKNRRNRPAPLSALPSPSSGRPFFSTIPHTTSSPSPADNSNKPRASYFSDSQNPTGLIDSSDLPISQVGLLMHSAFDFPQAQPVDYNFLPASADMVPSWSNIGGVQSSVANSMTTVPRGNGHHRNQSSSSIGSPTAVPLYGRAQTGAQIGKSQNQRHNRGNHPAASLPTPTQTPTKNSFSHQTSPHLQHHQDINLPTSMALSQAVLQQHHIMDNNMSHIPQHAGRQSFSMQEPATPMTAVSDYHDNGRRTVHAGENASSNVDAWLAEYLRSGNDIDTMTNSMVPKFERTLTDAYNDELYFEQHMPSAQSQAQSSYLMPQNPMVQERLHDARMARTASSSTNQSGPLSPFKATSPFLHSPSTYGQQNHPMRRDGRVSPQTESEPKTISPQEAMLDYKATRDEVPLFGQTGADYSSYAAVAPSTTKSSQYQPVPSMTYAPANHGAWSTDIQHATLSSAPLQSYNFVAPSLPANLSSIPNPYLSNRIPLNRVPSRQSDRNPEFPAHLTSMESSASEAAPASSAASSAMTMNSPKPASNADTGTYSCTYQNCTQRFATPRELQKHKRDVHRAATNMTPGVGSGMSTAQLMERNSQSGPHRCERVNPTTGKPCNTNFSRPYDLTRHEDTIHNIRKLKLKCALCTEDKLFSRNDALTRHLRVVHPEVDFPGKHRRRGTRGE